MGDGILGRFEMAKKGIERITSDARPINSAPHRAGMKAREVEWTKINKMFRMNVEEPAHSERALPIVLAPK